MRFKIKITLLLLLLAATTALEVFLFIQPETVIAKPSSKNLSKSEIAKTFTPKEQFKVPVLMYHHIGGLPEKPDALRKDLTVSSENFEWQMKQLKKDGYSSITLEDLNLYFEGKKELPSKPVIITFDDGYKDVFDYAVPVLKTEGFLGSFAIITGWTSQTMGDNIYASWQQILEAKKEGMEIVCHTQNHFDGTNKKFNSDYISQNLKGCKADLEKQGINTSVLVYPYGHYTSEYIKVAKEAGFKIGVTTKPGSLVEKNNLMEVKRLRPRNDQDPIYFEKMLTK